MSAVGALAIVDEYATGTVLTTFAAVPSRRSVMVAKAVVVAVVTTVFGALAAGLSFAVTQAILDLPFPAWLRLAETTAPIPFPWTTGRAWTVYAVWACAACAIAVTGVHRRDQ
ncbi:hypothetical protein [Streptomyces sp. NPDC048057]|uniref:hypothetical protein n=1 Tax=Streptomyces sp. NPDC048057 TaxID=3155628 RepID=UPI0033D1FCA8